ncbi:putative nucleotide-diphospho-sugar transferase [Sedimentitalea todarodis]|uniref:Nucleotide-diphospho-sugar transferase n=1 Tax=Sedimentitalea todarodis TaxID=1631240 RepID=A0ABU3VK00_9RHOB|nr:putative nucleotide-diphospho-sugar transferase [Sedimentitalea todarodis]MDU9006518.1 putative nucleotide-diphospho-sugar transferase [Sedimentitalea todarodis]
MSKDNLQAGDGQVVTQPGTRGFAFATTGKLYTDLARRAARTIRTVMPDALIDLFTDQDTSDDVFDKIHSLPDSWRRPKMYAVRCSRFERTIVLDADIVLLADVSDVFDVLDRFDIAGVLGNNREPGMTPPDPLVPNCLPVINSGVLAVRASAKLQEFALAWENDVRSENALLDQPAFRKRLYLSNLDFAALGLNYNCIQLRFLDVWSASMGAPRILHVRSLHDDYPGNPEEPFNLTEVLGEERAEHIASLLAADWSLGGDAERVVITPMKRRTDCLDALKKNIGSQAVSAEEARVPGSALDQHKRNQGSTPKMQARVREMRLRMRDANAFAYQAAILAAASRQTPLRICVVGAKDGKHGDPIYEIIRSHLRSSSDLLLFEPQEYLHPFLAKNYSFHPSHRIIGAAIGPEQTVKLHAIHPEHWKRFNPECGSKWPSYRAPTAITTSDRGTVLTWIKTHLPEEPDPERLIVELDVPCGPLVTFLQDAGRDTKIDVLQVDAEGFDDEVIYACSTKVTQPSVVRFGKSNLSAERLERLMTSLSDQYLLQELGRDMMAVRRV